MSELSPARWAYLKRLRPSPGRFLHISVGNWRAKGTYNVGRNKAKRAKRAAEKEARARVSRAIEELSQYAHKQIVHERLNFNQGANTRQRGQCN